MRDHSLGASLTVVDEHAFEAETSALLQFCAECFVHFRLASDDDVDELGQGVLVPPGVLAAALSENVLGRHGGGERRTNQRPHSGRAGGP